MIRLAISFFFFSFLSTTTEVWATEIGKPDKTLAEPLSALSVSAVHIAGISSGAFMAQQMQMAYPEEIVGVGVLAGGVWGCSDGDWQKASKVCMKSPESLDVNALVTKAKEMQGHRRLGNPIFFKKHRVFIFHGTNDSVVSQKSVINIENFYASFGLSVGKKVLDLPAGHGFPTLKSKNPCEQSKLPWMINCNYDISETMLQTFVPSLRGMRAFDKNNLKPFDQVEFATSQAKVSEHGTVYVPQSCQNGGCQAVIFLHGCLMGPNILGDQFIEGTELLDWAEGNDLVVVFPATQASQRNPNGCWDWFAYTQDDFLSREAPQIKFLKSIIDRVKTKSEP